MKTTDTVKDQPMFPEGTRVYSHVFHNPHEPKTVLCAEWRGAEYHYILMGDDGALDAGYLAKDLSVTGPS